MQNIMMGLGAVLAGLIVYSIIIYNKFISLRRLRDEAWSGILVQLKKRHDLVPNLVETVKGYASHEKTLMEELTRQRSMQGGASPQKLAEQEGIFSGLLSRLMVVAEAYPELKASANFASLQNSLAEIEDAIQMSRRYYNGSVREYNILVESFPSLIIANIFKFQPSSFFELDDPSESAVPKVSL